MIVPQIVTHSTTAPSCDSMATLWRYNSKTTSLTDHTLLIPAKLTFAGFK